MQSKGKHSALCLNGYRTKLYPQGKWADMKASAEYQEGLKERYKIEQKNAEAKRRHGLDRCRYVSWRKYALQAYRDWDSAKPEADTAPYRWHHYARARARGHPASQSLAMPR